MAVCAVPFAIGTIALDAVAIVHTIERSARDQIAAIDRHTEAILNEARHAPHHRAAREANRRR